MSLSSEIYNFLWFDLNPLGNVPEAFPRDELDSYIPMFEKILYDPEFSESKAIEFFRYLNRQFGLKDESKFPEWTAAIMAIWQRHFGQETGVIG